MDRYLLQTSSSHLIQVSNSIYKSSLTLSLTEYIIARKIVCSRNHKSSCTECDSLLTVAQSIFDNGYTILSEAFRRVFPKIKYTAEIARRRLLQMPLVSIVVGNPSTGTSLSYLLECQVGVNYEAIQRLLASHLHNNKEPNITKAALREILSMAQSNRERELIRYTAFVSGNFTQKSARKFLGLEDMNRRVERCLKEARDIRECIDQMVQEEISSLSLGFSDSEDDMTHSRK